MTLARGNRSELFATMNESSSQPAQPPRIYKLRAVTARIKEILLETTTKRFWVQAHLVSKQAGFSSGHFYCDLVETDDRGRQVSKMGAVIWKSTLDVINRKLQREGHDDILRGNKEICALCSVEFHEVHGLKLQIHDIDPTFGEAQIDRNRRVILERLTAEGLLNKNKSVTVPAAALRIGLITANHSAAFSDFTKTLSASPFAFKVIVAAASMQGARLEQEVLAALEALIQVGVEVICLVRGGGSQVDLAWFDNERLARAIAAAPVPVWVGIGHEIDVGVLDFVAHTSFKTPTAVAEHLVRRLAELDQRLAIAEDRLRDLADRQITLAARNMERSVQGLLQGTRKHHAHGWASLEQAALRVKSGFESHFAAKAGLLDRIAVELRERSRAKIDSRGEQLSSTEQKLFRASLARIDAADEAVARGIQGLRQGSRKHLDLNASRLELRMSRLRAAAHQLDSSADTFAGLQRRFRLARYEARLAEFGKSLQMQQGRFDNLRPEKMLRRGYSITRDAAGRIVTSVADVRPGERLSTQLADGTVQSTVEDKEP